MAQEDILPQIFAEIYAKANPPPPSDNQQLNKIEIPNDFLGIAFLANAFVQGTQINKAQVDTVGMALSATATVADPTNIFWGGSATVQSDAIVGVVNTVTITHDWKWGAGGRWG